MVVAVAAMVAVVARSLARSVAAGVVVAVLRGLCLRLRYRVCMIAVTRAEDVDFFLYLAAIRFSFAVIREAKAAVEMAVAKAALATVMAVAMVAMLAIEKALSA